VATIVLTSQSQRIVGYAPHGAEEECRRNI